MHDIFIKFLTSISEEESQDDEKNGQDTKPMCICANNIDCSRAISALQAMLSVSYQHPE